jgi:hypothetical protein
VVIGPVLSRVSAGVLLLCGVALLFAPDVVLPALIPPFPPAAAWLGQLLGAAWLGLAALNWLQRRAVLGGIYGRPVVIANLTVFFVSALSLIRALPGEPPALWAAAAVTALLAAAYGVLLFAGPFEDARPPSTDGAAL